MVRLLLALCVCLLLSLTPGAVARAAGDAPAGDERTCSPQRDDDAGETGETGDDTESDDELEDEDEDEDPGDDGADDDELGEDDELEDPQAEAEAALPAPGYRDFCEAPVFDRGFLRRAWRLRGDTAGFGDGVLTVRVSAIPRLPARYRQQASRLAGLDMAVVVDRRTKLSRKPRGGDRRRARRVSRGGLARARQVEVQGKLLPPSRWRKDADGLRVPTLRAGRISVIR